MPTRIGVRELKNTTSQVLRAVREEMAEYVVTFPSWYPQLVADPRLTRVYQTNNEMTRQRGGDNMAVYRVSP